MPVAAESNRGKIAVPVKSSISTSNVKTMAATGALKMAAIAAADPHASNKVVCLALRWKKRPRLEPIAEPVNTIGASNPTDPPKPTVMALEIIDE